MDFQMLANVASEVGISIGVFALCAYLTIYIVKRLAQSIDKLLISLEKFMDRVRNEHDRASQEHKALMEQHKEMINTLGRINGYKNDRG